MTHWTPALRQPTLARGDVHLYRIPLDEERDWMRPLLSKDEQERAARFHFEEDRRAFIIGRAHMRRLLSLYVGVAPERIEFAYGPRKKPRIEGQKVKFNLSNAGELALLAVSLHEVGVDVELCKRSADQDSVASHYFSQSEVGLYRARPSDERARLFFTLWTRKESYLKALGDGLHVPLHGFDVMEAGSDAPVLNARPEAARGGPWTLRDLEIDEGYAAALAVEFEGEPRVERFSAL